MTLEKITLNSFFEPKLIEKWQNKYPILLNRAVEDWIIHKVDRYTRSGRPAKRFKITNYLKYLNDYCKYYGIGNPSALLKETIDVRNDRLIRYLSFLIKGGRNEVTVRNAIQSVLRSFYSDRGNPTSDGLAIRKTGENQNEIILDKEIIRKIQTKMERPEYRLAVKFLTQTGLRTDDIFIGLKSGNYKLQKYKDHFFIRNFVTMKTGIVINFLFFPKELTNLMTDIYGGDSAELDLQRILLTKTGKNIRREDVWGRAKDVVKKLGYKENMKLHCFRKFFDSVILRHGDLDLEFKEHLLGHSAINLSGSYNMNLKDIEWFYEKWRKIENLICIDSVVIDRTATDLKDVKKENSMLKKQVEILLESKTDLEKKVRELNNAKPSKKDLKDMIMDIMRKEKINVRF